MPHTITTVPEYLIELWKLNFNHQPNKYSSLIIPLIRISIAYHRKLNNSQHSLILQKLTAIAGSTNVTTFLKLEILNYLRHIAGKHFTVEYQNDILKSIRQLFNKSFIDPDPIVKKTSFTYYARVVMEAQHENILLDNVTDDESVKMELFDFIKKKKILMKSRDEQRTFLKELSSPSMRHECAPVVPSDDDNLQKENLNEIRMKEIIDRIKGDMKELMELNQKQKLTAEICENIASIRRDLDSIK